ncbi:MAG: FHA domain-containing protein [Thermoleophilia bacterium]|nr:FHA domain-containing protein [Thermoleophilia bacterium]
MVTCPSCAADRPDGDRFCGHCGASIPDVGRSTETTGRLDTLVTTGTAAAGSVRNLGPALAARLPGGGIGEVFPLTKPVTTVGRSPGCDIFLDDITVSRLHAEVREGVEGFVLVDDGSTNGTYVNRRLIVAPEILADRDEVQVGKFRLVFIA